MPNKDTCKSRKKALSQSPNMPRKKSPKLLGELLSFSQQPQLWLPLPLAARPALQAAHMGVQNKIQQYFSSKYFFRIFFIPHYFFRGICLPSTVPGSPTRASRSTRGRSELSHSPAACELKLLIMLRCCSLKENWWIVSSPFPFLGFSPPSSRRCFFCFFLISICLSHPPPIFFLLVLEFRCCTFPLLLLPPRHHTTTTTTSCFLVR